MWTLPRHVTGRFGLAPSSANVQRLGEECSALLTPDTTYRTGKDWQRFCSAVVPEVNVD